MQGGQGRLIGRTFNLAVVLARFQLGSLALEIQAARPIPDCGNCSKLINYYRQEPAPAAGVETLSGRNVHGSAR